MVTPSSLNLTHGRKHFTLPDAQPDMSQQSNTPQPPEEVQKLHDFAERVCVEPLRHPTHLILAETRLLILDRFLELHSAAPKRYRKDLIKEFLLIMTRLRECELTVLSPQQLYIPPPPEKVVSKPVPRIAGVFLGELDNE